MADSLYDTLDPERLKKPSPFSPVKPEDDPGLMPRINLPEQNSPLKQFGAPTPAPQSILGSAVPPGGRIEPKQMPKAEGEFHGTDPYHGMLKSFGDRKAAIDSVMPTDVHDPNYMANLVRHAAQQGQIKKDEAEFKKEHPWGSADPETGVENHPGTLGKIGHVLGTIGNVAGNVLAPNVMAQIPGSRANLNAQEARGEGQVEKAIAEDTAQQKAEASQTTAGAHQLTAETKADVDPRKAAVAERAEDTKENTLPNQVSGQAFDSITSNPNLTPEQKIQQLTDLMKQEKAAQKPVGQQHVAGMLDGKQAFGNFHPDTGKYTDPVTGAELANFRPTPPQTPAASLLVEPTGAGGEGKLVQAKPGMTLPAGTQNIGGFAQLGRPTTQMRNVSAQADVALAGVPDVINEIKQLAPKLGPVAGRWNDFVQGKIGMDNPEFAGLQADLVMLSSAVALAHARGRLPENLRQEFDHMMNAPQQTPDNLVAVLEHVSTWMQRMGQMGGENPFGQQQPSGTGAPAAPTNAADPLGILK